MFSYPLASRTLERFRRIVALPAALLLIFMGGSGEAQAPADREPQFTTASRPLSSADSASLHRSAREAQARFERIRVRHSPYSGWPFSGSCDEIVGRFCLRFPPEPRGGWEDDPSWRPPPDPREIREARGELLVELARVAREQPGNRWVWGQWVRYLGEAGRWDEALRVARSCRVPGEGWCGALEGLALHSLGRVADAEAVYRRTLGELPAGERESWLDLELVVDTDTWGDLRGLEGEDRTRLQERIWRISDPLFLVEGNALFTEHISRRVLALLQVDTRNPHALSWGRDMEEMLIRYGPEVAYERVRDRSYTPGPTQVVGRYDPFSRAIVPSAEALREPAHARPEAFSTTERRARSRHAPVVAPTILGMEAQSARFRRGDDLLIVAAWEIRSPLPVGPDSASSEPPPGMEAGLFLLPVESSGTGGPLLAGEVRPAPSPDGSLRRAGTVRARPGGHVLSVEFLDREGRRAWRYRKGVEAHPRYRDVVELSDLLLLEPEGGLGSEPGREGDAYSEGGEITATDVTDEAEELEDHLSRVRPSTRLTPGPVEVAWEVYGLQPRVDRLPFRITVEREDRGLLRRAGEALRLLSAPSPVEIRWEEGLSGTPSLEEGVFRRVHLDLSGMEPGSYELKLELELPGRTPAVSTRRVEVEERPSGS